MKRFYKSTSVEALDANNPTAFQVLLDGRPLPTPAKKKLHLPSLTLAEAIAKEWADQGEEIDAKTMPFMTLASTSLDRVEPQLEDVQETIAAYGANDLLVYWADGPSTLVKRQADTWGPHLDWAKKRFPPGLKTTAGIMPIEQDPATLEELCNAVRALNAWQLAGVADLTQLTGSLILPIALFEDATDVQALVDCTLLDERFHEERWGEDQEATATMKKKETDIRNAASFLNML